MELEIYAEKHTNRNYQEKVIDEEIVTIFRNNIKTVVEIGCGDGALAYTALKDFPSINQYFAFDPSDIRVERLRNLCSGEIERQRLTPSSDLDVISKEIKGLPDVLISEQVIEHVEDEKSFLKSILELSGPHTIIYISTVFICGPSYYYYKNDKGVRVLDPTHIREYHDDELLDKIRSLGFEIVVERKLPMKYPLSSFINKLCRKAGFQVFKSNCIWVRLPFYFHWRIIIRKTSKV